MSDEDEFVIDFQPMRDSNPSPCRSSFLVNATLLEGELHLFSWIWSGQFFTRWTPVHHISLQLANLCLLILFIIPTSSATVIWRLLAMSYSACMISFGYFVFRSLDLIAWNSAFFIVNLLYLVLRAVRWRGKFAADIEQVYRKLFSPLRISRPQFSQVLNCKRNNRILHPGDNYAIEKITRVDSLALLLSGRLLVSQQGRPLHIILPHQFVDSPEYFGVSTDELFQVTITAMEDSKLLIWHRDKLRLTIMSDEFLRTMFDHIIGRDVVRKLIQVSDSVSAPSANGFYIQTSNQKGSSESDPMLENSKDLNVGQFGTSTTPFESRSLSTKCF